MKDAVEYDGVDLLGYTMWSPIDIVSASTGEYDKRYGFIYVNYNNNHEGDFSRSKKKSFDWYKHVIETNGVRIIRMGMSSFFFYDIIILWRDKNSMKKLMKLMCVFALVFVAGCGASSSTDEQKEL